MNIKVIQAASRTLFVFGLVGFSYIAANAVFHPESLSWPLTHFLPFPREDTFGAICFAVSFVSYFVWNMVKDRTE